MYYSEFPWVKKLTGVFELEMSDGEKKKIELNSNNPIDSFSESIDYERREQSNPFEFFGRPPEPTLATVTFEITYIMRNENDDCLVEIHHHSEKGQEA